MEVLFVVILAVLYFVLEIARWSAIHRSIQAMNVQRLRPVTASADLSKMANAIISAGSQPVLPHDEGTSGNPDQKATLFR